MTAVSSHLRQQIKAVAAERSQLLLSLCEFFLTDTILFVDKEAISEATQHSLHEALSLANRLLQTECEVCSGLQISALNRAQQKKIKSYLQSLSDEAFAVVYLTATEIRSVLLAILLEKRQIDAQRVFDLAFFEELQCQQQWGKDAERVAAQEKILTYLKEVENFVNEYRLSEN